MFKKNNHFNFLICDNDELERCRLIGDNWLPIDEELLVDFLKRLQDEIVTSGELFKREQTSFMHSGILYSLVFAFVSAGFLSESIADTEIAFKNLKSKNMIDKFKSIRSAGSWGLGSSIMALLSLICYKGIFISQKKNK